MKKKLINVFLDLAGINATAQNERPVADYLKKYFKNIGIILEEDTAGRKISGNSGNLYGFIEGKINTCPAAFLAHMDTVGSTQTQRPIVTKARIMSNGKAILGADDRAGIALLCGLAEYLRKNKFSHRPVEIIFTVAEETALLGSQNLNFRKIKSKNAFVLDAGGSAGTIVNKSPSIDKFSVEIKGRPAHAGIEPERGINAIMLAARAVSLIRQGRVDDETTVNIGIIKGGEATNIVPERVYLEGEVRSFRKDGINKQKKIINTIFRRVIGEYGGIVKIEWGGWCNLYDISRDAMPVRMAVNAAENIGLKYNIRNSGGGSDANILNQHGIESICLGIGMFSLHSKNEYLLLNDFYKSLLWMIEITKEQKKNYIGLTGCS